MARGIKARLIERIRRTKTVESFRFRPEQKFDFIPGQFTRLMFDQADANNKYLNKYLSFSSSPLRDYLEVTKRLSDSLFSQRLKELKSGEELLLQEPRGHCVFKHEYTKIGFLLGGIGITPAISIIEYIVEKKLDTQVTLIYSNRTEEDIAFKAELDSWSAHNPHIKIVYTVSDCEPRDRRCLRGIINKEIVLKNINDIGGHHCFIFGPPAMVSGMKNICREVGCSPQKIKAENFVGY